MPNCPLRSEKSIVKQLEFFEKTGIKTKCIIWIQLWIFNPWWAHQKDRTGKI